MNAKRISLLWWFCSVAALVMAQEPLVPVLSALERADSVVLVSHEHFRARSSGYPKKKPDVPLKSPKLILEGKLNKDIVREYQHIDGRAADSLSTILALPEGKYREYASCFDPHHAILIYHDKAVTYMDICFKCKNYITSAMTGREDALDPGMLKRLKQFFKGKGFIYMLD